MNRKRIFWSVLTIAAIALLLAPIGIRRHSSAVKKAAAISKVEAQLAHRQPPNIGNYTLTKVEPAHTMCATNGNGTYDVNVACYVIQNIQYTADTATFDDVFKNQLRRVVPFSDQDVELTLTGIQPPKKFTVGTDELQATIINPTRYPDKYRLVISAIRKYDSCVVEGLFEVFCHIQIAR